MFKRIGQYVMLTVVAFVVLGATVVDAEAAPLFKPSDAAIELPSVNDYMVTRKRLVTVRFSAFYADLDTLELNFFEDASWVGNRDRTETGTSDGFAWYGRIPQIDESKITLVVGGGKLSGTIEAGDFIYNVRHLQNGIHLILELDRWALPDGDPLSSESADNSHQVLAANSEAMEEAVFDLVNRERAIHNLTPLNYDDRLADAAYLHAEDMSINNYFSHTSQDGRSPGQRITDEGYQWNAYGENIAWGYGTPEAVMSAWMNSSGHQANILKKGLFCDLGVGYVTGNYWVQDFAREAGVSVCTQDPGSDDGTGSAGGGGSGSAGSGGGATGSADRLAKLRELIKRLREQNRSRQYARSR